MRRLWLYRATISSIVRTALQIVDSIASRIALSAAMMLQTAVRASPTGCYRIKLFSTVFAIHYPSKQERWSPQCGGGFGVVNFGCVEQHEPQRHRKVSAFLLVACPSDQLVHQSQRFPVAGHGGQDGANQNEQQGESTLPNPRFSSSLFRAVVCGTIVTPRNACQRRTNRVPTRTVGRRSPRQRCGTPDTQIFATFDPDLQGCRSRCR
jgi:hypothetical protein